MRKCCRCKVLKLKSEFGSYELRQTKRNPQCRSCCSDNSRRWREKNKERHNATVMARYHAIQLDPVKHARFLEQRRQRRQRRKYAAFEILGRACSCCGESCFVFLQIDHINNDGAVCRKRMDRWPRKRKGGRIGWGTAQQDDLYKSIIAGNTDGLQLLCANCNWGKARNGGICPHSEERARLKLVSF